MNRCVVVVLLPLFVQSSAVAQTPARAVTDSARRAVYRAYLDFDDLVQDERVVPHWMPDGSSFWFEEGGPQDRVIQRVDPATSRKAPLFDAARLRTALTERLGHEPAGRGVPFAQFSFIDPSRVQFDLEGGTWRLDLDNYSLERLPRIDAVDFNRVLVSERTRTTPQSFWKESFTGLGETPAPERLSPDGKWFVSTRDHNIALRATIDGRTVMRTSDGTPDVRWMVETTRWNPWSPNGQRFVAFKSDVRGMARIPSIQWLKPLEEVIEVITIPAGGKLNQDEVYVLDAFGGTPVHLDLGETIDGYLVVLGWLPDNSRLLVAKYNRLFSRVDIFLADAATGASRIVMTEESKTFLTGQHLAVYATDVGFRMLPDGTGFIWRSARDGWQHLYRYDVNGALVGRLTQGAFPVIDVVRVDQPNGWVYYSAHGDQSRPYDSHLYRVNLTGGRAQQLTEGAGTHAVSVAPSAQYFVDTYSTVDVPPRTELRRADGTRLMVLGEADVRRLRQVGWVPPKEFVVKAADGVTDLWATMYFPFDFDSTRKYPVIEYIYGGPQIAVRPMEFDPPPGGSNARYNRALANLGFLVVTIDARGTPRRSKAFHDAVYHNWGTFEMADHGGAIRQLGARLPYMDMSRVGIWGRSWGAHYSLRALAQANDIYSVATSEFPGFEPGGGTLYEPYLGMPHANPATYDAANAILLADKVRGRLLLVSGTNDTGTMRDMFKMSEALIRIGFQHDVMVYPNTGHGPTGRTAVYNEELRTRYFLEHLRR